MWHLWAWMIQIQYTRTWLVHQYVPNLFSPLVFLSLPNPVISLNLCKYFSTCLTRYLSSQRPQSQLLHIGSALKGRGACCARLGGGSHTLRPTHDPFHSNTHHIPEDGRGSGGLQIRHHQHHPGRGSWVHLLCYWVIEKKSACALSAFSGGGGVLSEIERQREGIRTREIEKER